MQSRRPISDAPISGDIFRPEGWVSGTLLVLALGSSWSYQQQTQYLPDELPVATAAAVVDDDSGIQAPIVWPSLPPVQQQYDAGERASVPFESDEPTRFITWPSWWQPVQPVTDSDDLSVRTLDEEPGPRLLVWSTAPVAPAQYDSDELPVTTPVALDEEAAPIARPWTSQNTVAAFDKPDELPISPATLGIEEDVGPPPIVWPLDRVSIVVGDGGQAGNQFPAFGLEEETTPQPFVVPPDVYMVAPWSYGSAEDTGRTLEEQDWNPPVIWSLQQAVIPPNIADELPITPATLGIDEEPQPLPRPWLLTVAPMLSVVPDELPVVTTLGIDEDVCPALIVCPDRQIVPPVADADQWPAGLSVDED